MSTSGSKGLGKGLGGVAVAIGLIVSAVILGNAIRDFRTSGRFVTVKGLAERDEKADLVIWPIKARVTGNDLVKAQDELEGHRTKINGFLVGGGLKADEITNSGTRVIDRQARDWVDSSKLESRYIVEATLIVRSSNVDLVKNLAEKTSDLLRTGIVFSSDFDSCQNGPRFSFTKLNSIKAEMLAEATKVARKSAEQFAADSGSKVGAIRQANQGTFSINDRDLAIEGNEGSSCERPSDIYKKIRVVTTLDFFLE